MVHNELVPTWDVMSTVRAHKMWDGGKASPKCLMQGGGSGVEGAGSRLESHVDVIHLPIPKLKKQV